MTHQFRVVVECQEEEFLAYPVGLRGVVCAEGPSHDQAVTRLRELLRYHVETFGPDCFGDVPAVLEALPATDLVAL